MNAATAAVKKEINPKKEIDDSEVPQHQVTNKMKEIQGQPILGAKRKGNFCE